MASRAEHRDATLRALSRAAVEAMEIGGPDVGLDDIADRAGVARRTIYRWVESRDDLLFIHPRLWLDEFDRAIADVVDAPLSERIKVGAQAVCAAIDADPEPVARSMRLALAHPQLMRGNAAVSQEWIERMASEVLRGRDETERFRSRVIGAAIMGVIDAALFEWIAADAASPITELVVSGLDHLAPLLVDA